MIILIAIIGALINRARGGWLTDLIRETTSLKSFLTKIKLFSYKEWKDGELLHVKDLHDLVFAITFGCVLGLDFSWSGFLSLGVLFIAMDGGKSMGWGGYISAMIDKKIDHNRSDVWILDKLFMQGDKLPVLRGWAALSLRGFIWTAIISAGFALVSLDHEFTTKICFMPLVGLAMGSIYLFAIKVGEAFTTRGNGWQLGELFYGAYSWAMFYWLVT